MTYGDTFADYVPTLYDGLADEIELDVRDHLTREAAEIQGLGVKDVTQRAIDGFAANAILDEVGDAGASIVVMATHGRSGVGRWVLDSVVLHSTGPVLVVRPTASD